MTSSHTTESTSSAQGLAGGPQALTGTSRERADALFAEVFGTDSGQRVVASAPGRVELCGNHTDHQGGKVISAAMDRRMTAVAAVNGGSLIHIVMEGFGTFELDLAEAGCADARPEEYNTSAAIIRGMLACYGEYSSGTPVGFDAVITSDVPAGAGVSSSAAFEMLMGNLYCGAFGSADTPTHDPLTLALTGCKVEREWFGKPAGAQDQMACSIGGALFMDFANEMPTATPVPFDAVSESWDLVLINSGFDHGRYPDDFAAIPRDMAAVAAVFGKKRLGDVDPQVFFAALPGLRDKLGDRAVLRACHYYDETSRVQAQYDALMAGTPKRFLALARLAGMSSAEVLQNATPAACLGGPEQPVSMLLALCAHELGVEGAWRIHGGGFGGSVLAFVPKNDSDRFVEALEAAFKPGCCMRIKAGCLGATFMRVAG